MRLVLIMTLAALSGCSFFRQEVVPEPIVNAPVQPPARVQHLIFFDWDQDTPPENVNDILAPHVHELIRHPERKLLVEGAADETGSEEYNRALGMRRANTIASHLLALGVAKQQLIVRSIGIERPLNVEGRAYSLERNRRVTLVY